LQCTWSPSEAAYIAEAAQIQLTFEQRGLIVSLVTNVRTGITGNPYMPAISFKSRRRELAARCNYQRLLKGFYCNVEARNRAN